MRHRPMLPDRACGRLSPTSHTYFGAEVRRRTISGHAATPRRSRTVPHAWPMLLGIDHLVIAVADPDAAAAELEATLGLAPGGGGRHDRLGTFNRLVWLGDSYLELIGVFDRASAAGSWIGAPTLRALEAGGGLATWAIASDDLAADVAGLRGRGSTLAEPVDGERVRPDGRVVRWRLSAAEPLDRDRPPFLIEHDPSGSRMVAGRPRRACRGTHPTRRPRARVSTISIGRASRSCARSASGSDHRSAAAARATRTSARNMSGSARPATARSLRTTVHLRTRQDLSADIDALGCRWILRPEAGNRAPVRGPTEPDAPLTAAPTGHIRNTPKRVSGIGAWSAASMPIVRTRRVSSGSMTPSSHRRAVAK